MSNMTAYDYQKIVIYLLFMVGTFIITKSLWSLIEKAWNRSMTWKDAAKAAGIVPLGLALMFLPAIVTAGNVYISPMPVAKPGDPVF